MSKKEKILLIAWLVGNILIGLLSVNDFGVSYDEPDYYLYAQNTVDAYRSFFGLAYAPFFGPHDLPNYGPAFIIFPELALRFLKFIFPNILAADVWHFSYFLIFQLGGLCLYTLARRWFRDWSAWGILVLYTSQPLLWGHAYINPKDIPFLAFFLFTVWSGFRLGDSLGAHPGEVSFPLPAGKRVSLPRFTLKEAFPYLRSAPLLLAGTLLGMTMSIRLLGPLPGLIVILYLAFTLEQRWLPVVSAYLICAAIVMFFTWPYLWPNPIDHWMDSLVLMVNFPWPGRILFNGQFYDSDALPISYLPTLLNVQLTEPLLILMYAGFIILIYLLVRRHIKLDLFLLIAFGGVLPLAGLIVSGATMYDNFRQILFLLPPLMLLAGFALDRMISSVSPSFLRLILLIGLAFPGGYAIRELHPYQYVYYNSLVGGMSGAFRRFELDYWCISYREAALWLNRHAPANASIGGDEADFLLGMYLRRDLVPSHKSQPGEDYDYFVGTSRYNHDLTLFPDGNVVYSIERDGAILTVVKQLSP